MIARRPAATERRPPGFAIALLLGAVAILPPSAGAAPPQPELAPGWRSLAYEVPVPGTYELPPLGGAADGEVLDSSGRRRRLHQLFGDRVVVLSFFYRTCPDINGCPLANHVLSGVGRRVRQDAALRRRVRLLSMSFDPLRDTPETLRRHAASLVQDGDDWLFLTTDSEKSLAPILREYGQAVQVERDAGGQPLGTFSHVLRVYLIDRQRRIRNIYSSSFLHADTVASDLRTLLLEEGGRDEAAGRVLPGPLHGQTPGGPRPPFAVRGTLLGLPPLPVPSNNPLTAEKIALGRKLFFDRRLSRNGTMSCAMCHVPAQGFTSNQMATAVGIEGRTVRRNAPTILNVAYAALLFHDGRETSLEQQVWGPLLAANEMGAPSVGHVLDTLRSLPDYDGLFDTAFPGRGLGMETFGMALASYERTLIAADSPFDRWYFGRQAEAMSPEAQRGFALFNGTAGCVRCHAIGEQHALFSDQKMHNTGVGYRQTMAKDEPLRVQVAPEVHLSVDRAAIAAASERPPADLGRYEISENPDDRWKYKTPMLRNVALTPPYMHDGSLPSLRAVVDFYDQGGIANELLDPAIRPLHLQESEKEELVRFFEALTGDVSGLAGD